MPIVFVGGLNDLVVSPEDYRKTCKILKDQNSLLELIEVEFGHVSIVHPDYKALNKMRAKRGDPPIRKNHMDTVIEWIIKRSDHN